MKPIVPILLATFALTGCLHDPAEISPEDAADPMDDPVERVLVTFDDAGAPSVRREVVSRAQQRDEEASRRAGGFRAVGVDTGCAGASLWLYSGAGRSGAQLCLDGTGSLALADIGWTAGFGSYWAGGDAGALADATAAAAFGCEEAFGAWVAADAGACGRSADTVLLGESVRTTLRIGTFNAAFLTSTWVNAKFLLECRSHECRADHIAARIIASDYDLIALNEVFDEDARAMLLTRLRASYPYIVARISTDTFDDDSGLMLFSRLPFEAPAVSAHLLASGDLEAEAAGAPWSDVSFVEFDGDCSGFDCRAAKGVAYVRVRQPSTGRRFGVLFSHMQASYGDDDEEEWAERIANRGAQLGKARTLLDAVTVGGLGALREQVFFLGDLNIDGDTGKPDRGGTFDRRGDDRHEWFTRFDPAFGATLTSGSPLLDAWAFTSSPADRGLTQTNERLDYILTQRPEDLQGALCVQHMSLAFNLGVGTPAFDHAFGAGMGRPANPSDHRGLNAELAPWGPQCTPRAAAIPAFDAWSSGTLLDAGNVQWWHLPEAGTYTLLTDVDAVSIEAYRASDLSRPLAFDPELAGGPGRNGLQVSAPEPLYLKVLAHNPRWRGNYRLRVHRNACTSPADACHLFAGQSYPYTMAAPWYEDGAAWFLVATEVADSGMAQSMRFIGEHNPNVQLEVLDATTLLSTSGVVVPGAEADGVVRARFAPPPSSGLDGGTYYLLMRRTGTAAESFHVRFDTNLTHFHGSAYGTGMPLKLFCDDETEIGMDEISIDVLVDGVDWGRYYLDEFDDDSDKSLPPALEHLRFVGSVTFRLVEHDDVIEDYTAWSSIPAASYDLLTPATQTRPDHRVVVFPDPVDEGQYTLRYNLSR